MYEFFVYGLQFSIVNSEGTVAIQNACAGTIVLSDVLYFPKVTKNLISVGQLCDDKQAVFSKIESGFVYGERPPDQRSDW